MQILSCDARPQGCVTVRFSADAAEYETYIDRVYRENRRNFRLAEYPDGRPPRQAIEAARGKSVFWFDAFNLCVDEAFWPAYYEALARAGLRPLCRPEFSLEAVSENGFTGTARAPLLPQAEFPSAEGLCTQVRPEPVQELAVFQLVRSLQKAHAAAVPSAEPLADGDIAVIDYHGAIDGRPFAGGDGQGYRLVMGQNQPFPGFYNALRGQTAGSTVLLASEFPYYMKEEELDGKTAHFSVEIRQSFHQQLPPADDALARQAGYPSMQSLKDAARARMEADARRRALDEGAKALLNAFALRSQAPVPDEFVQARGDALFLRFKQKCASRPIGWRTVVRQQGLTEEQFQQKLLAAARVQLCGTAALIRFAEAAGLKPCPAGRGALLCDGPEDELWPTEGLTGADRALVFAAADYFRGHVTLRG